MKRRERIKENRRKKKRVKRRVMVFVSFFFFPFFFFGKGLRKSLTVKSYGLLSRDKGDVRNQDHRGAESN